MRPVPLVTLVPAFQVPTLSVAVAGVFIELMSLDRLEGTITAIFAVPTAVAMLLAALTVWALERWRPAAEPSLRRTILRAQLAAFGFTQPVILFYAWIAGIFWRPHIEWDDSFTAYAYLMGGHLVLIALPLLAMSFILDRLRRRPAA